VVYDVGTWPPPHGPVPPSEQNKSKHLYGITIVGNGASSAPAGINYGCNYTVQQGSYLEVTPQ